MLGTVNCIYETPCGWCTKWDKEYDKKKPIRGNRAKINPIDDAVPYKYSGDNYGLNIKECNGRNCSSEKRFKNESKIIF